jgi:signal transduction histidine kinase
MGDLVDDLLALSRLQAGDAALRGTTVDLGDLVSDTVAALLPLADAKGVRLAGSAEPGVRADVAPAEVRRAVTNLLANGIRHTPPGGSVTTTVGRAADDVVVTVQDQCGGIPEEVIGRVFETGYRGTAARTPTGSGSAGLGLTIVRGIVEAHGGAVSVRNVGSGCRFEVAVPLRAD